MLQFSFFSDKAKTMDVVRTSRSMVHPLHVHKLFYTELYDTTQTIYSLKTVLSILNADGKDFVFSSATMSMSICSTAHQTSLRELLIRHRRALTGKDFYGSLADSKLIIFAHYFLEPSFGVKPQTMFELMNRKKARDKSNV